MQVLPFADDIIFLLTDIDAIRLEQNQDWARKD